MPLCKPIITGPLSELSTAIHVQTQMIGANVTIVSLPTFKKVAEGKATSADQFFPLIPTVQLKASDLLFTIQELGGEKSEEPSGNMGMGVQPRPHQASEIGPVGFITHLYEGGQFVGINGIVPGALVEVMADNQVVGTGMATEGQARLSLNPGLPPVPVRAHQVVKLANGMITTGPAISQTPDPLPIKEGKLLPPPKIKNLPLHQGDYSIELSEVLDGAVVTIRSHYRDEAVELGVGTSTVILRKELIEGEEIKVKQDFYQQGEWNGLWSESPAIVSPLGPIEPPEVKPPLCIGQTRITLQKLHPGSKVYIYANGVVYNGNTPLDKTECDFQIPELSTSVISVQQEVGGVSSTISDSVPVEQPEDNILPAEIVKPLFAGARNVSVNQIHPGATIQVFAKNATKDAPISDHVKMDDTRGTIDVAPFLLPGDEVYVAQWVGSDNKVISNPAEKVSTLPELLPPSVLEPVEAGDAQVYVWNAVPGASVEVSVQRLIAGQLVRLFAGHANANTISLSTLVPCRFALRKGDTLFARQVLGNRITGFSRPLPVIEAREFGPRPFYVAGHNPNTIREVRAALDAGANAIEPDVNVYEEDPTRLCISHDEGDSEASTLEQFLQDLHALAQQDGPGRNLSLVMFDCKPKASTPEFGLALLTAIRKFLTHDTGINIVISVADFSQAPIFDKIKDQLWPREGLVIDEEDDPLAVSNFFTQAGVTNQGYGNGISIGLSPVTAPEVRPSMERVCAFRSATNKTKFTYVWTVNDEELIQEYIRIGVDGMITDDVAELVNIVNQNHSIIRMANRTDNPLRPSNFAYSLSIHTGDVALGGTDANITFTLQGNNGSASVTVDTIQRFRMERDDWNYVTLQSPDLGDIQSIIVQRDNHGIAPDWYLDRILVESFRYGVSKLAIFNRWIDSTSPFTQSFT